MNPLTTAPTDDTGVPPVPPEGSPKSSGEGDKKAWLLSDIHREHHKGALRIARQCRVSGLGAEWARMMDGAATARFYFATLRGMGE